MFLSFFPQPRLFFWSALLWTALVMAFWYSAGDADRIYVGLSAPPGTPSATGISRLLVAILHLVLSLFCDGRRHLCGFLAILLAASLVGLVHPRFRAHRLRHILPGSDQRCDQRVVWALLQSHPGGLGKNPPGDRLGVLRGASGRRLGLPSSAVGVGALNRFFVSHYVFRWRTAMNDHYMSNWGRIRLIEGSSQRVQDDTMRFSRPWKGSASTSSIQS